MTILLTIAIICIIYLFFLFIKAEKSTPKTGDFVEDYLAMKLKLL